MPTRHIITRDPRSDNPSEELEARSAAFTKELAELMTRHNAGMELVVVRFDDHLFTLRNAMSEVVFTNDDVDPNKRSN